MRYVVPIVPALEVSQLPPLHPYLLDERTYNSLFFSLPVFMCKNDVSVVTNRITFTLVSYLDGLLLLSYFL